ncbi:hypothetical protein EMCRGX_G023606 [Ephydatia muelleri]
MDSGTFSGLLAQLGKEPFSKDKIAVLNSYKHCLFSGAQLGKILEQFPHSSDKEEAVRTIAPQLTTLSGQEAKQLIKGISFSSDQVKVVRLIARFKKRFNSMKMHYVLSSHIDPSTKYETVDAIAFSNDRAEARKYLDAAVFVPGPYGGYPQQPYPPQQPGYPPQQPGYPPQQPGYPPQQPGYPPQQPGYPPQQPGYPPQQPGYPPQQPGYPPQQPGYPPQQPGYPPQQPGYPLVAFPSVALSFPSQQQTGGFPPGFPAPGFMQSIKLQTIGQHGAL